MRRTFFWFWLVGVLAILLTIEDARAPVEKESMTMTTQITHAVNPNPERLPTLSVWFDTQLSPGRELPMVSATFPNLLDFTCDAWCYESAVDFLGARPLDGGRLEVRHRSREHPQLIFVTIVTPEPGAVEFRAHAEVDPEMGGELPAYLPSLNLCWQLRRAPGFASTPEPYPAFVERCFLFTERGRTFLHQTERRKIPVRPAEDRYNNPPWVQMYAAIWREIPQVGSTSWADYSPDRYLTPVIGTISRDGRYLAALANDSADMMAQAWHDCLHDNPRWLPENAPPAERTWRLKVYVMENDPDALLERVARDFPRATRYLYRPTRLGMPPSSMEAYSMEAHTWHVSPTGDDANPGTREHPFATLERARAAIRQLKAEQDLSPGGITVWIHGGTYERSESFRLTEEDSGTSQSPITYRAMPGEEVRISGGRAIPAEAFHPVTDPDVLERLPENARGHVLQVDLNVLGISDVGIFPKHFHGSPRVLELFCDDEPMTLARWPNEGWLHTSGVIPPVEGRKADTFTFEGDRPRRWAHAEDARLHGYWAFDWYNEYAAVEKLDPEARRITITGPLVYGLGHPYRKDWPRRYVVLNLLEELDAPGEWYLDRRTNILYFWPPHPLEESVCVVSLLDEPLVSFQNASHVALEEIILEAGRGTGVQVEGGSDVRIVGCMLRNLGTDGILVRGGRKHRVESCILSHLGASGIRLEGGNRRTLTPAYHVAVTNHIHHFGRWQRTYAAGIHLNGVGHRVAHNLIHDAPHSAILLGGNDHLIEYNEIHDVCLETDDCGAFYTGRDPSHRGNQIRFNFWHHIGHEGARHGIAAVYIDDGSGGYRVYGNVFYRVSYPVNERWGACFVHGGHGNVFENNLFVECMRALGAAPWDDERWQAFLQSDLMRERLREHVDITRPPYTTHYPELVGYFEATEPRVNLARNNVVVCSGDAVAPQGYEVMGLFVTDQDPGFVDADAMNFQLRDDARLFHELRGFQPIPFEQMGLIGE